MPTAAEIQQTLVANRKVLKQDHVKKENIGGSELLDVGRIRAGW